jgi:hypothetical protein
MVGSPTAVDGHLCTTILLDGPALTRVSPHPGHSGLASLLPRKRQLLAAPSVSRSIGAVFVLL